ncbi:MAG TPA: hypothetical protein PKW95_20775 [bacterium]|nr:hypothetical protein [bacterium]
MKRLSISLVLLVLTALLGGACKSASTAMVETGPPESPAKDEATREVLLTTPERTMTWINGHAIRDRRRQYRLAVKTGDHLVVDQAVWFVKERDHFLKFRQIRAEYGVKWFLDTGTGERLIGVTIGQNVSQATFDAVILNNPDLTFVSMWHCKNVKSLVTLKELRRLEALNMWGVKLGDIDVLREISTLKSLDLTATLVTDDRVLSELKNLVFLKWDINKNIKNADRLANLRRLRILKISETGIEDFRFLAKLKKLECLDVGYTSFADAKLLSGLKRLQYLTIAKTKVRDIEPLGSLTRLEYLDAGYTRFGDASALAQLPRLSFVIFADSRVPDEGIDELKKQLPNCRFYY